MKRGISRAAMSNACLLLVLSLAAHAYGDPGKELFDKLCASCHTIGGGDTGGPDLKGVTAKRTDEWLVRVIAEPEKLTADKDPVQLELVKKYGYEMPNVGVGRDDTLKIVAFLKEGAGAGAAPPAAGEQKPAETAVTPELVARGRALFTGARPFAKGGAPCSACHPFRAQWVTGGTLAADLTDLYEGMGEQGMRGVLKSLKFPVMKKIYADRPLTDEEVTALVAFAKNAATHKGGVATSVFPGAGIGFAACFIVGMILYKRRTR